MYVQITTKCQMHCAHCMFSCTMRGQHMSMDVFDKVCQLAADTYDDIFIGGGEPTLHPNFWEILARVMAVNALLAENYGDTYGRTGLVTNGGFTPIALRLAAMAKLGLIECDLSQDAYHDEIDAEVVKAFEVKARQSADTRTYDPNDRRAVRNTSNRIVALGRAKLNQLSPDEDCGSCDVVVAPDGRVWRCCCRKEQIGDVTDGGLWLLDRELSTRDLGCSSVLPKLELSRGVRKPRR